MPLSGSIPELPHVAKVENRSTPKIFMIGNGWGGGLVPFITTAAFTATGSLAYALIYPIAVPAVCLVLSLFLMPETRQMSIWESGEEAFSKG